MKPIEIETVRYPFTCPAGVTASEQISGFYRLAVLQDGLPFTAYLCNDRDALLELASAYNTLESEDSHNG